MEQPAADVAQGTTPVLAEALTNQNMAERNQTDPIATPFVRDTCGVACSTAVCKDPADTSSMLAAASAGSPHACSTLESSSSSGSSSYGTGHVSSVYSMTASDDPDAAAAAAVEGSGASLAAFDTASEVQLMAAQVLQRKHQKGPAPRSVPVQVSTSKHCLTISVSGTSCWHSTGSNTWAASLRDDRETSSENPDTCPKVPAIWQDSTPVKALQAQKQLLVSCASNAQVCTQATQRKVKLAVQPISWLAGPHSLATVRPR